VASIDPPQVALEAAGSWWAAHRDPAVPLRIATSAEEIRGTVAEGQTAVVLHFQGTAPLAGRLELADAFAAVGVRAMQLTYNHATAAGDGCLEERGAGLSAFGRRLVERLQALGVAVDPRTPVSASASTRSSWRAARSSRPTPTPARSSSIRATSPTR
jgi:membrane dipeptidase